MKQKHRRTHLKVVQPRYPNAADNRYFAKKALDMLTGFISIMGFVFAMLFLAVIC